MSEKSVKKMANLLRNGATMLDLYCPQCSGILFRLQNDDVFCPNCNQKVILLKNGENVSDSDFSDIRNYETSERINIDETNYSTNFLKIKNKLFNLIENMISRIENTSDFISIEKSLQCIDQITSIIQKLDKINERP